MIAKALVLVIGANWAFTALTIGAVLVVALLAVAVVPELPIRNRKRPLPPEPRNEVLRKLEETVGNEWLANYVTDPATRRRVDAAIADARSTAKGSSGEERVEA